MNSFILENNFNIPTSEVKIFTPYIIQHFSKLEQEEDKTTFHMSQSIQSISSNQEQNRIEAENQKNMSDLIEQVNFSDQNLRRKRKKKNQKNHEIQIMQKDDGRGGNCIASNISKTLLRIIYATLRGSSLEKFKEFAQKYQIRSQKQNTVILINFLYLFTEQGQIEITQFQKIIRNFMENLKDSKHNCQKRMKQQPHRAEFHRKNQRMYEKFIRLSEKISLPLIKKIKTKSDYSLSLMELEQIMSDTYDRKQRQIEKAISKLKSIILNYEQLKNLYNYYSNRNINSFFDAIEYAYRRNLPKRCKQIKTKVHNIYCYFLEKMQKVSQNEQYLIFFSILDVISEKKQQIWKEFVNNIMLKIQYNCSKQEQQQLSTKLRVIIPQFFAKQVEKSQKDETDEQKSSQIVMETQKMVFEGIKLQNLDSLVKSYNIIKIDFHL